MNGTRQDVLTEVRDWLGTPYHHAARVKGAGVDCLMLLLEVYGRAGVFARRGVEVASIPIPRYARDIMLHRNEETYLEGIRRYAAEVMDPAPGNIALWKFGRIYSHAGIITDWPAIIHAYAPEQRVVIGNAAMGALAGRPVRFFDPWGLR
ncbi:cell wall-associated hydrolase [Burkholderiales bacterium GJ-E10]|nr:cell wall-associated hydrolase [Burkholderiales bacterium GJ-E10]